MTVFGPWPAVVLDVHDGDTMTLVLDLGFDLTLKAHCRMKGINAPELSTTAGQDSRRFALTLAKPGDLVHTTSYGWDKYGGRYDGTVQLPDGRDFATVMLQAGMAVPFMVGEPREPA
jgi:endonuclease YncB( thermonuclease family)